jgi:Right handed beta helix region
MQALRDLLLSFALLLSSGVRLNATQYYVSSVAGFDTNNGTSTGTAWANAPGMTSCSNTCASTTLNPGDIVSLQAGGEWRQQLTAAFSGSLGMPITYNRYGSGALPIISGANIVTGFSQVVNPTGSFTQGNSRISLINGSAFLDFGVSGSLSPFLGDLISVCDSASHCITGYIKAAGTTETYGPELLQNPSLNTTANVSAFFDCTISSVPGGFIGNALQVATTGADGNAGQLTNTGGGTAKGMLTRSTSYLEKGTEASGLCLATEDSSFVVLQSVCALPAAWTQYAIYATDDDTAGYMIQIYQGETSGKTSLFNTATFQQVLTPSNTGVTITSTPSGSTQNWTTINASFNYNDPAGYTYSITGASQVWTKTVTTQPNVLIFNSTPGVQQSSLSTVNSVYTWFYSGTTLYVYSPSTDPSMLYAPLEAGQRDYGITGTGLNYVTFNGLQVQYANFSNIGLYTSSNITITNNVVTAGYYEGIEGHSTTTGNMNWMVTGNIASWNGHIGIVGSSNGGNWVVSGNTTFNNAWGGSWTVDSNFDAGCGIRLFGPTNSNNIIENNVSYNNGLGPTGLWNTQGENQSPPDLEDGGGVMLDTTGIGNIMRNNIAFNNEVAGLRVVGDQGSLVYGNISYGNVQTTEESAYDGMGIDLDFGIDGTQVYNNTFYGNQIGILAEGNVAQSKNVNNLVVKNNLSIGNLAYDLDATVGGNNDGVNGSGNVYIYNGFGLQSSDFIQWGTATYFSTYASWETASGNCGTVGCSHSLESAVTFVNPSAGVFYLPVGSPALTASSTGSFIGALGALPTITPWVTGAAHQ